MTNDLNRYKLMERYMTYGLLIDTAVFIIYLIAAGNGIGWLRVIFALIGLGISGLILWILYASKEIFKQRSLWITVGAGAIAICLLMSLLLEFPSPNKYKQQKEETAYISSQKL